MSAPVNLVLLVVALGGAAYLAIATARLGAFALRRVDRAFEFLPSVTVLKPIAGSEPDLYQSLRSCCDQEYDAFYEVVFCLHAADDSALAVAERIADEFPTRARIAIGHNDAMANPKIANLAKCGVEPRGEIVIVADSDIRVGRDYLRALAASFASERVGAATCLYAGIAGEGLVSRLGAMQIEEMFIPSVLVALVLGPLRFCLGATMAVRSNLLKRIGGLEALGQDLADDHKLGELVNRCGRAIELSRYVVQTAVSESSLSDLWSHELRWARTNFALAPAGYAFSFLMYAFPFALLYLAVSGNVAWGVPLLAVVAALRLALHYVARYALGVTRRDDALLIPLRDFLSLAVWCGSFLSRTVRWRNRTYSTDRS